MIGPKCELYTDKDEFLSFCAMYGEGDGIKPLATVCCFNFTTNE